MKKVLFLINTLCGGGAEKVLVDTVNSLDREKYQITVQTLYDVGVFRDQLAPHIRYKTIISIENNLLRKIVGKLLFCILNVKWVYNLFVRDTYDYEIAFLEGMPTKILSHSTNHNANKIAWVHTDLLAFPDSVYAFGTEEKEGQAYSCFDKVFCVSNAVQEAFEKKYGRYNQHIQTLYNIIDDKSICNAGKEDVELPTNIHPCMISVGRLTQQKGFDRLLRIHKKLIDEGYLHSLLILGDGDKRAELEKYIKENGLSKSAFLLGFQKNPHKYMSKANLFVCSSYAEGFSMVISESVLCGTPVISTAVSGAKEPLLAPRCSVIVDNEEKALYEALRSVLENPACLERYKNDLCQKQKFLQKEFLVAKFEESVFSGEN